MSIEAMGTGLKTRLETITALDVGGVYAPNGLPKKINEFPSAIILQGETEYHNVHSGANVTTTTFRVIIVLTNQDQPDSMSEIVKFTEPTGDDSVVAAIEGDRTLGGAASDCFVFSNTGMGTTVWGNESLLSTEFDVRVLS